MSLRLLSTAMLLIASHLGCEQRQPPSEEPEPRAASPLPSGRSIADVAAQVTPSVVSIVSEGPNVLADALDAEDEPGLTAQLRQYSVGSGVIVAAEGLIVTSFHVVAHAERIGVALSDGRTLEAKMVAGDPQSDLAVLRVDASDLPAIGVADSTRLRIGEVVLAVGNPFGIGQTVTMGIVSAVGRTNMGITRYDDLIQTDAAINPGSSGGALVNMEGELVGINTAILSRSGGYQGIGFAIPSKLALQIKDALIEHGRVIRGWMGAGLHDLTEEIAGLLALEGSAGVLVADVAPDSPAAHAGLRMGDVITAIDGTKMDDAHQLRNVVELMPQGQTVRIEALRDREPRSFDVTIGEEPVDEAGVLAEIEVQELDARLRTQLELPEPLHGVVVTSIGEDTPIAMVGLVPGDVILEVNGDRTPTVEAFREAADRIAGHAVALVYRGGALGYLTIGG